MENNFSTLKLPLVKNLNKYVSPQLKSKPVSALFLDIWFDGFLIGLIK